MVVGTGGVAVLVSVVVVAVVVVVRGVRSLEGIDLYFVFGRWRRRR